MFVDLQPRSEHDVIATTTTAYTQEEDALRERFHFLYVMTNRVLVLYPITLQIMLHLKLRNMTIIGWKTVLLSQHYCKGKRDSIQDDTDCSPMELNRKLFMVSVTV